MPETAARSAASARRRWRRRAWLLDADTDLWLHLKPDPLPGMNRPIQCIDAVANCIVRTPVRHRGKHR